MSEDWIPVPEIEKVLIVLASLADSPEDLAAAPAMNFMKKFKEWSLGSVYVFHNPPEAGEILEDVDMDMAARFALAAQVSEKPGEICRDAFRRVFSRAVVQQVVLVNADYQVISLEQINEAFALLEDSNAVWGGDWNSGYLVGIKEFYPELFLHADDPEFNLRNSLEEVAKVNGLTLKAVDNF